MVCTWEHETLQDKSPARQDYKPYQNSLLQAQEGSGIDVGDLVFVEGEDLERVQPDEGARMQAPDAVVVHIEDEEVLEVAQRSRRHRVQPVLRHVQLRQHLTCNDTIAYVTCRNKNTILTPPRMSSITKHLREDNCQR